MINNFERDLSHTVEELRIEKERSSEAVTIVKKEVCWFFFQVVVLILMIISLLSIESLIALSRYVSHLIHKM